MKKIALLTFVLILLSTAFLMFHTELEAEVQRDLRLRFVDVAGNPVSNLKVTLIHVIDGHLIHVHEQENVSERGILEWTVAEGTYEILSTCKGYGVETSPSRFEVTEDTEILVTAYLIDVYPLIGGRYGIWVKGILYHAIEMYDMMNGSVTVVNCYNTSKDVTIDVRILDASSRIVAEASNNMTVPALNDTNYSIALPPPSEGWVEDRYFLFARIYDEQIAYREKSSDIWILKDRAIPFWWQWWFWVITAVGIMVLVGAVYFFKKRKPLTPTSC